MILVNLAMACICTEAPGVLLSGNANLVPILCYGFRVWTTFMPLSCYQWGVRDFATLGPNSFPHIAFDLSWMSSRSIKPSFNG